MFTGIIETLAKIEKIVKEGDNVHFTLSSSLAKEFKIDQSVAHNGVCLTVIACDNNTYTVTAILETLNRTNLSDWKVGDEVNLERAMMAQARMDGHIVQGHVDTIATVHNIENANGSWVFTFAYPIENKNLLVDKGSVCINGTSLTVVSPKENLFSVAIIPYTFQNTIFKNLNIGSKANIEFDIIGKYIANYAQHYFKK